MDNFVISLGMGESLVEEKRDITGFYFAFPYYSECNPTFLSSEINNWVLWFHFCVCVCVCCRFSPQC